MTSADLKALAFCREVASSTSSSFETDVRSTNRLNSAMKQDLAPAVGGPTLLAECHRSAPLRRPPPGPCKGVCHPSHQGRSTSPLLLPRDPQATSRLNREEPGTCQLPLAQNVIGVSRELTCRINSIQWLACSSVTTGYSSPVTRIFNWI